MRNAIAFRLKTEEQLCAAVTTETFLRFTSPEPVNLQREAGVWLMAIEMGDRPSTQCALRVVVVVVVVVIVRLGFIYRTNLP